MADATEESMGDLSNPMVMKNYYNKLLPWKAMFIWLNQGHGELSPISISPIQGKLTEVGEMSQSQLDNLLIENSL